MNILDSWQTLTVLLGGVVTLAVFSFLIKENPLYRFFEHLFIGIAAGLGTVLAIRNFLWPNILVPMLGLDIVVYPDGSQSKEYNSFFLLYLLPLAFGLLYYCSYSKKYSWLSKLVIGFTLGMSGGIAFKAFFSEWIPQIASSFKPLVVRECVEGVCAFNWWQSFENIVFLVTLFSVMYYFFFSFERHGKAGERFAYTGRWLMMICFGAFFGSTVMARMALLVERVQFLLIDWSAVVAQLIGISSSGSMGG